MKNKNLIGNTEEGFKAEVFAVQKEVTIDKKSLMVSDWVKDPIDNNTVWQWEPCDYEEIEVDVLPIPITTEILEANGFEVEEEYDYCMWGVGNRYELTKDKGQIEVYWRDSCDEEDLIWYANICGFNACADMTRRNKHIYVHEFQHALRLCGLKEIADSIKI